MNLPTDPNGRVAWQLVFTEANLGKTYLATRKEIVSAYSKAKYHGFLISSRTVDGQQSFTVKSRTEVADKFAISHTEYNAAVLRDADTVGKLKEARENLAYWRKQQQIRTTAASRADAGARVLAWQMQVNALSQKLTPVTA